MLLRKNQGVAPVHKVFDGQDELNCRILSRAGLAGMDSFLPQYVSPMITFSDLFILVKYEF